MSEFHAQDGPHRYRHAALYGNIFVGSRPDGGIHRLDFVAESPEHNPHLAFKVVAKAFGSPKTEKPVNFFPVSSQNFRGGKTELAQLLFRDDLCAVHGCCC